MFDKPCRYNVQPTRELHDIDQAHVSFPALYPTHLVPMQVGQFRQFFLREAAFHPKLSDTPAEQDARVGVSHPVMIPT
jgi:hypothetical protein